MPKNIYHPETARCEPYLDDVALKNSEATVRGLILSLIEAGYSPADAILWITDCAISFRAEYSIDAQLRAFRAAKQEGEKFNG